MPKVRCNDEKKVGCKAQYCIGWFKSLLDERNFVQSKLHACPRCGGEDFTVISDDE